MNTVILGKDYYYQISTILPVGDEQYSKAEKMYDLFLNSFSLLARLNSHPKSCQALSSAMIRFQLSRMESVIYFVKP